MSSWPSLLESLHSALVDELTERYSQVKPELGLPLRQSQFAIPHSDVCTLCFSEIFFGDIQGVAFLAVTARNHEDEIWSGMIKRARAEFGRREIQPRLHTVRKLQVSDGNLVLTNLPDMKRVIWIPLRLPDRVYYLGLGV